MRLFTCLVLMLFTSALFAQSAAVSFNNNLRTQNYPIDTLISQRLRADSVELKSYEKSKIKTYVKNIDRTESEKTVNVIDYTDSAKMQLRPHAGLKKDSTSKKIATEPQTYLTVRGYLRAIRIEATLRKREEADKNKGFVADSTLDLIISDAKHKREVLYWEWLNERIFRWLPTRNTVFARKYYGSNFDLPIEPVKNNFLQFNNTVIGAYSELFNWEQGPMRFSLGGFVSRSTLSQYIDVDALATAIDTTQTQQTLAQVIDSLYQAKGDENDKLAQIENFTNNGGNLMLMTQMPILEFDNEVNDTKFKGTICAFNKMAINTPYLGAGVKDVSFFNDFAMDFNFSGNATNDAHTKKNGAEKTEVEKRAVSFYVRARTSLIAGTKGFMNELGLLDEGNNKRAFFVLNVNAGVKIIDNFELYARYQITSESELNKGGKNFSFGIAITPTAINKNK